MSDMLGRTGMSSVGDRMMYMSVSEIAELRNAELRNFTHDLLYASDCNFFAAR